MSDGQIRIGLIGCGGNMRGHVKTRLNTIPEARVVALADTSEEAIKAMVTANPQTADAPKFADYREMLDKVKMDAVIISTPHKFHCDQIVDSLDHGLHVLTEKPMVCTVAEAKRVIAKRDQTGKIVEVAYQRHFAPAFRFARHYIQSGQLGEVYFMTVYQCQSWWHPSKLGRWRFSKDLSGGGQLNDSGSHLMDILLWMTGLVPEEAFAYINNRGAEIDVLTAASVKFTNGALCNISVIGECAYPGMDEGEHIWGEKGYIGISSLAQPTATLKQAPAPGAKPAPPRVIAPAEAPPGAASPDHNFIAAILGKEQVEVPAECGLRVIQASEAIWESAAKGQPVKVRS